MSINLSVMDKGAALLEEEHSNVNFNTLQKKEIGLSILLLGLAEKNALRIKKLSGFLEKLEDELFDESIVDNLTRSEKIELFNLASNAINSSSTYIRASINSTNWEDLSTKLKLLASQVDGESGEESGAGSSTREMRDLAYELLSDLGVSRK